MKYLIVIEKTRTGFSAYSPDVDGCIATGETKKSVQENMREALAFHLQGLREQHRRVPKTTTFAEYLEIAV